MFFEENLFFNELFVLNLEGEWRKQVHGQQWQEWQHLQGQQQQWGQ